MSRWKGENQDRKQAICMFITLHKTHSKASSPQSFSSLGGKCNRVHCTRSSISAGHHRLAPPGLIEAELVQLGHPLRRDLRVRVAGIQPLLVLPLVVDPAAQLRVGQPCVGTRQCPCPGMALKATSLAKFASQPASLMCPPKVVSSRSRAGRAWPPAPS